MPAPQQSSVPSYKETANIPRIDTTRGAMIDARDTPGYALARLLGALPDAAAKIKSGRKADEPGENEQAQLAALAEMGASRDRLRLARGGSVFGLLSDKEATMDAYELNRGRRDADLFAGDLRDAYAKSGLAENDDPKAFQAFVQQYQKDIFDNRLKGADPAYHHGFVTSVSGVFKEMAQAHAGNLDGFITSKNKRAFQARLDSKVGLELSVNRERDAFGNLMDNLMGSESGGNYNAFHGNGNNRNIRFTDMTIGEVLDFQRSGAWRRHGAKSSAVGKYQFIQSTLEEVVRQTGISLDTKFTPGVQDKLIFARLVHTRGMKDYLEGRISAEDFLDKGLSHEFAGLKKTSGRGHYDDDGINKATHSARKSLAALIAFKEAYLQDPASVKASTDEKGKIVLNDDDEEPSLDLDTVESEFGVSLPDARKETADSMIRWLEADPSRADREDLEDFMARKKLPKAERQRVVEARDRLREERTQQQAVADKQSFDETISLADRAIRKGDPEALAALRKSSPRTYQRVLEIQANPPSAENADNDGFIAKAQFGSPEFPQVALRSFVAGEIDKETYASAMGQYEAQRTAKPLLSSPAIKPFVDKLKVTLPGEENKKIFDAQLALAIQDLTEANGGKRPSLTDLQQAATSVHQAILSLSGQEAQVRMARPEYQIGQ